MSKPSWHDRTTSTYSDCYFSEPAHFIYWNFLLHSASEGLVQQATCRRWSWARKTITVAMEGARFKEENKINKSANWFVSLPAMICWYDKHRFSSYFVTGRALTGVAVVIQRGASCYKRHFRTCHDNAIYGLSCPFSLSLSLSLSSSSRPHFSISLVIYTV